MTVWHDSWACGGTKYLTDARAYAIHFWKQTPIEKRTWFSLQWRTFKGSLPTRWRLQGTCKMSSDIHHQDGHGAEGGRIETISKIQNTPGWETFRDRCITKTNHGQCRECFLEPSAASTKVVALSWQKGMLNLTEMGVILFNTDKEKEGLLIAKKCPQEEGSWLMLWEPAFPYHCRDG